MGYDYSYIFKEVFIQAIFDTVFMVALSSCISIAIALVLAIILYLTDKNGLSPNKFVYSTINVIVNIIRSFPFLILMVSVIPLTRLIVGTSIGKVAALVPLTIVGACFFSRLFETSFYTVNMETIEAARSMGASKLQIIRRVVVKEAMPSIVQNITTGTIEMLGITAAAGAIGAGGLGAVAIMYGYQNFDSVIMYGTVIVLIVIVQIIQVTGNKVSKTVK